MCNVAFRSAMVTFCSVMAVLPNINSSYTSGETLLCAAPPLIAICRPYLEPARFARQNLSVEIPFHLPQI